MIDLIRFIIGTTILSYAAYSDLKYREASNKLWLVIGAVGIILLLIEQPEITTLILSIAISFPLAFSLYFFGIGGADVKAMWGIALLVPIPPTIFEFPLFETPFFVTN